MHLTFCSMTLALKYEHVSTVKGVLMVHLKAQLHLMLKLRVHLRLQLSCT